MGLIRKDPNAGQDWRQEEKGMTEDEVVGWHYWLNGHEFEQALGVGNGQGSLACCSPWGSKESDTTERLNWAELRMTYRIQENSLFTFTLHFLRLTSLELMMPSNHLILCHPLLFLPSIFASSRLFSNESVLRIRWPKYWSFSFSISPSKNIQDWSPWGWTDLL